MSVPAASTKDKGDKRCTRPHAASGLGEPDWHDAPNIFSPVLQQRLTAAARVNQALAMAAHTWLWKGTPLTHQTTLQPDPRVAVYGVLALLQPHGHENGVLGGPSTVLLL